MKNEFLDQTWAAEKVVLEVFKKHNLSEMQGLILADSIWCYIASNATGISYKKLQKESNKLRTDYFIHASKRKQEKIK